MNRTQGKVALVTGCGSMRGIGAAIAQALASEGAAVVVTDIREDGAAQCAAAIRDSGGKALALAHDVANEEQWIAVLNETARHFGRLDIL
ncbi:MAG: SDR family NAD(P)-dependent oxidoreductase, partial [Hyphomonadaceae bacterium]